LTVEDNLVMNMTTGIELPPYKEVPDPRGWQAYSVEALFRKYGSPSHIGFKLSYPTEPGYNPDNTAWYDMVLEYDDLHLIIEYFHGWTKDGNQIKACPLSDQFENIGIYLGKAPPYPPGMGVPLEKATSLSIEQFSDLMKRPSNLACFYITRDAVYPNNQ
jgi:hypothetical protein